MSLPGLPVILCSVHVELCVWHLIDLVLQSGFIIAVFFLEYVPQKLCLLLRARLFLLYFNASNVCSMSESANNLY